MGEPDSESRSVQALRGLQSMAKPRTDVRVDCPKPITLEMPIPVLYSGRQWIQIPAAASKAKSPSCACESAGLKRRCGYVELFWSHPRQGRRRRRGPLPQNGFGPLRQPTRRRPRQRTPPQHLGLRRQDGPRRPNNLPLRGRCLLQRVRDERMTASRSKAESARNGSTASAFLRS